MPKLSIIQIIKWFWLSASLFLAFSYSNISNAANNHLADTVWIEPLRFGAYFRGANAADRAFKKDVVNFVRELKTAGFKRVVIAYSTIFDSVLFEDTSEAGLPDYLYYFTNDNGLKDIKFVNPGDASLGVRLVTIDPNNEGNSVVEGRFIVDILINAAANAGLEVILGLTSAGDKNLLFDYALFTAGQQKDMYISHSDVSIYNRIYANNIYNMLLADFFVNKYPEKIAGFYLTQEAGCIDHAMKYHWSIIADHIKQTALNTGRRMPKIWVSPVISAQTCEPAESLQSILFNFASASGSRAIAGNPLIDIIMYQDGAGAASLPIDFNTIEERYWFDLDFDPGDGNRRTARQERINRSSLKLSQLKNTHAAAGAEASLLINLEAWEMDGNCSDGVPQIDNKGDYDDFFTQFKYGCPYAGDYTRILDQAQKYMADLNIGSDKIMLNEGSLSFDFSQRQGSPSFSDSFSLRSQQQDNAQRARCFTQQYIADGDEFFDQCVSE